MTETLLRMAAIREAQGLSPIDGSRIQGEGPEPPPLDPESFMAHRPDEDPDFEPEPEPSPLIPPAFRPMPQPAPQSQPVAEPAGALLPPELAVVGLRDGRIDAWCKGVSIEFTAGEVAALRRLFAKAGRRLFDSMAPKRRRRASIPNGQPVASEATPARKPVRRVRRKSLLKDAAP